MNKNDVVNRLIIPPGIAEKIVAQAGNVYLRNCPCRSKMQKCSKDEWEICMLFDNASEEDRQQAKLLPTDEAMNIVRMSIERGDIHQAFYFNEGERIYELCNCCTCCCSPLRKEKEKGEDFQGQLQSGYIAVTDDDKCIGCGECLESCFFDARHLDGNIMQLVDDLCFGCGSCMTYCPEQAIRLENNPEHGIPVPRFQF